MTRDCARVYAPLLPHSDEMAAAAVAAVLADKVMTTSDQSPVVTGDLVAGEQIRVLF